MSAESKFKEAVENFDHGDRYQKYLSVVRLGLFAYGDEDEGERVFEYIMENAPPPRPNRGKVRSAIRYALEHPLDPKRRPAAPAAPRQTEEDRRAALDIRLRQFVPSLQARCDNASDSASVEAIQETVNLGEADYLATAGADICQKTAAAQLRAMFAPGEMIWAGQIVDTPTGTRKTAFDGRLLPDGGGIIEAHELARRIEDGLSHIPTHISVNPQTGRAARLPNAQTDGTHLSYDCLATVAAYRNIILEWDDLSDIDEQGVKRPSRTQIEIVAGLVDFAERNPRRIRLVCATSTGKRSIHCVVRVKASNRDEYRRQLGYLRDLFASADDPAFRVDTSGWETGASAIEHCRLAGAFRPETRRTQRLVWIERRKTASPSSVPATAEPTSPQTADPFAWGRPSPVVPSVVAAVETFDRPPTASELAGRIREREGTDLFTATRYIRRTVDAGGIIEARICGFYRYALHATDFRLLTA